MTRLEEKERDEREAEEMQLRDEDRQRAQNPSDPRTETMRKKATLDMNRIMAEAMDGQRSMNVSR